MLDYSSLHIGVFASLKRGFEHFIYRELTILEENGAAISVYPTKVGAGLYGPRSTWDFHPWTVLAVLFANLVTALTRPIQYFPLLLESLRLSAVVDFGLAVNFARQLDGVNVLYSTFGDRKFFIGYFCKRLSGLPLVCTIHAYEIYQNPNPKMFAHALPFADQIITVSQYNFQQLKDRYGVEAHDLELVRCCIDTQEYRPQKKFKILIVGFFAERKGHEVLFQAIKQLGREDFEVWVVGGAGAEAESVDVKGLCKQYGLESQVAFFGPLSDTALKAVYHACDVFCLPCHFEKDGLGEGFPVVLIEAMACGKPVISTRHVEIPNVIKRLLVDEKDVDGLARALLQVYESAELRGELSIESRQTAIDYFSASNVDQTAAIFQRVIAGPQSPLKPHSPECVSS
ncbi:MAG: glycosyltransferase family 4 protein [Planctomycetales bacterium]|nr:glycosyltransferase family 4 protein [Planctomycetales bacterium]MCA9183621.1 glycosyltransferase family 4 protein [Planctomycetales bacterium]